MLPYGNYKSNKKMLIQRRIKIHTEVKLQGFSAPCVIKIKSNLLSPSYENVHPLEALKCIQNLLSFSFPYALHPWFLAA